jgi:UDP-N-acetylmuramoyl-tripeptide--D-alanyl-D-alanine ligase
MGISGNHIIAVAERIENDNHSVQDTEFATASIDSRSMSDGAVFFAIRGEQRDGHDFVPEASKRAGAVVVDRMWWNENGSIKKTDIRSPIIIVDDTVQALGVLARLHRRKFDKPVLAITGTSGKTTTKDMVVQVLGQKYSVHRTKGNFNNHLGLPLTLFDLKDTDEISVVEIGMNHPGEIEYLCSIAEPTHGLITNIGKGHLAFFDSLDHVAREKGSLFRWIEKDSDRLAFINAVDQRVVTQASSVSNAVRYGFDSGGLDVTASVMECDDTGRFRFGFRAKGNPEMFTVRLPVPGEHQVINALAAATVGLHFGVSGNEICNALKNFSPPDKRNVVRKIGGITIVDDTYNANPDSMHAALVMFHSVKTGGKKILVLGDMLELGVLSGEEHGRVGLLIPDLGFEYVFTFGVESQALYEASAVPFGGHFSDKKKLVDELMGIIEVGDAILVKGSRGMRMEEIIHLLVKKMSG